MKKISLIVMSCMIACGLLANHGIVKGGEMSPKVEDTVSIDKKIADSQWLSNNSDTLEVDHSWRRLGGECGGLLLQGRHLRILDI